MKNLGADNSYYTLYTRYYTNISDIAKTGILSEYGAIVE